MLYPQRYIVFEIDIMCQDRKWKWFIRDFDDPQFIRRHVCGNVVHCMIFCQASIIKKPEEPILRPIVTPIVDQLL